MWTTERCVAQLSTAGAGGDPLLEPSAVVKSVRNAVHLMAITGVGLFETFREGDLIRQPWRYIRALGRKRTTT
jgi:hypothetical protein